jgi:L-ascorbate metabolism protein UlaG (beta-lactamase superfamily)
MCFIHSIGPPGVSRREFLGIGLAAGLTAATAGWGTSRVLPGVAEGAETAPANGGPGTAGVNLRWLGVDGWEITFGRQTVLVDPWLSRTPGGLFSRPFDPRAFLSTPLTLEEALIDEHVKKADLILLGHGHYDHAADVPYIARKTGATVIGTESHINLLRAYAVPEAKLVSCKGGEFMQFDGYTVEALPSLHSLQPSMKVPIPGRFSSVPPAPRTIGDMPEGDTLAYVLTVGDSFRLFLMSSANFVERSIAGLKPDVALLAPLARRQIHDFTPRLLRALNYPKVVLPTHWDNWERPLTEPPQDPRSVLGDDGNLDVFVREVKEASPKTQVVVLKYFESFAP